MFIALSPANIPVGLIRFEAIGDDTAVVSVTVDPARRGLGLGAVLIELGVSEMFRNTTTAQIHALIKSDNKRSRKAFEKAGFRALREESIEGQSAVRYVRARASDQNR